MTTQDTTAQHDDEKGTDAYLNPDRLLTVAQAAEYLGIPELATRGLIEQGRLTVVKLSERRLRIRVSVLEAFIDECTVPATKPLRERDRGMLNAGRT